MKLTNTQKSVMSKELQVLIEADFMTENGKLTDNAKYYLDYLVFEEHKDALLKRAKEKIAETEAEDKAEKKSKREE